MLKINDLRFAIGETQILNGVSFNIAAGETVGIIGPNGSGKTTLFNCISGFNIPQSGEITFRGVDITREPPHRRARHGLGRVFQNFGIFKELTLQENVILALESKQTLWDGLFPWSAANKRNKLEATQFLAQVGLAGKKNDRGSTLSGGQMRLLEMIRTLAYGAELFLLDEPTAGVSPKMKEEVEKLINRLCLEGKTTLIIEHDINFIQKFCSRIIVLDSGRVILDDTPQRVRESPVLQEIYFGRSAKESGALTASTPASTADASRSIAS